MNTKIRSLTAYSDLGKYYDVMMGDVDYPGWADYLQKLISKYKLNSEKCIDLGGGTGAMSVELGKAGVPCDVLDNSASMLKTAREKKYKLPTKFFKRDLRNFKLPSNTKYSLAFSLNNTVNYLLTKKDLSSFFKNISQILTAGGSLIMDLITPWYYLSYYNEKLIQGHREGISWFWEHRHNEKKQTGEITVHIFDPARRDEGFRETHLNRLYSDEDILKAADKYFDKVDILSGFSMKKRHAKTQEAYFILQKK